MKPKQIFGVVLLTLPFVCFAQADSTSLNNLSIIMPVPTKVNPFKDQTTPTPPPPTGIVCPIWTPQGGGHNAGQYFISGYQLLAVTQCPPNPGIYNDG